MRRYRKHEKRKAYNEYTMRSRILCDKLKGGEISQEEFDKAHELLDEQFNYVR